ncbi:MAG: HAMP domain-containing histidine kinase [Rhodocyclaceae bacterium]|nr:HAMP domain-containing histidine kinase [Rhodocyclaceae bacterium]MCA3146545.1 HAMP domain-containing histidine kinase [Rhodocyclaceae bacterium]
MSAPEPAAPGAAPPGEDARPMLRRLFQLRWLALVALAAVAAVSGVLSEASLPVFILAAVGVAVAALNGYTGWRLRQPAPVDDSVLLAHLALDTGAIAAVLRFTGGWTNPFCSLLLLPLVIAATALPSRRVWVIAALALGSYTLLGMLEPPVGHIHLGEGVDFGLHVLGMWISFVLSAGVVVSVVTRMAVSLRERDRRLAEARERAMRDQQVLALGTLAAGTAHELGTPLATMAVIARELELSLGERPDLAADARLLRQQVEHCKSAISGLAAAAGQQRAERTGSLPLDQYLARAIEGWQVLRPGVALRCRLSGEGPAPRIADERTLGQTLVSLLNNAADASPAGVEIDGRWRPDHLTLEIRDQGAGLPEAVARVAGRTPVSTKPQGMGIGLLLASSAIERFGGRIQLLDRDGGGALTRVELPLAPLAA